MAYRIELLPAALRRLKRLPQSARVRIGRAVDNLASNPRASRSEPFRGAFHGLRKLRVGNYRILYRVEEENQVVVIVAVADHREVYKIIERIEWE